MAEFGRTSLQTGDLVQLRWLGDRAVPHKLSACWARVVDLPWKHRWFRTVPTTFGVEVYAESGVERRIREDHIWVVERNGVVIAQRAESALPGGKSRLLVAE